MVLAFVIRRIVIVIVVKASVPWGRNGPMGRLVNHADGVPERPAKTARPRQLPPDCSAKTRPTRHPP
eukprot:7048235-Pyramimonas_sp.AAC.1